ncbi:unnamed protein product, partial [Closterium sp. Naga37s-1]
MPAPVFFSALPPPVSLSLLPWHRGKRTSVSAWHGTRAQIIHSILGIVRSPVSATLPQIASRLFLVWGVLYPAPQVLYPAPQVREHVLVASLLLSWSITEIVRYSFFAVKEAFGFTPAPLLWLRYSMFYVLYPSGITSEVGLAFLALPYLKASHVFSFDMPNKVNFAVDYYLVCILILLTYIP